MARECLQNKLFPLLDMPEANNSEANRLATFRNLGHCNVFASDLAKAGLVYTGTDDAVECYCCPFTYQGWQHGQRPVEIHKSNSPQCPLFTNAYTETEKPNIPIPTNNRREDSGASFQPSNSSFTNVQESGTDRHRDINVEIIQGVHLRSGRNDVRPADLFLFMSIDVTNLSSARDESLVNVKYPVYACDLLRAKTFCHFPAHLRRLVPHLRELGFFYTGHGDIVICFCCGLGLNSWQNMNDPKIVHARMGPDCHLLCKKVTPAFIEAVRGEMNVIGNEQ